MPGDFDDADEETDLLLELTYGDQECSEGDWGSTTRGDGDAGAEEKSTEHVGNYGVLTANWGGHWKEASLQEHMNRDLKSCPCHLISLQ